MNCVPKTLVLHEHTSDRTFFASDLSEEDHGKSEQKWLYLNACCQ